MAPEAVQTKHSVATKATSAPAAVAQAAMASPEIPSRSPRAITNRSFSTVSAHLLASLVDPLVEPEGVQCGVGEASHLDAVAEKEEGGHAHDAELHAQPPSLRGFQPDHLHLAVDPFGQGFDMGVESQAGPAVGSPDIDEHGALGDQIAKIFAGRLCDQAAGGIAHSVMRFLSSKTLIPSDS